ncbi:hypothetical protein LJR296_007951 [Cupriavidus necator]|uniref:hypothetical protein n=1 Tax=Cupriavidus necator TaxID=106590 RepID=UPI003ECFADB2
MATVIKTIVATLHVVEHEGREYHVQKKPDGGHVVWTQQTMWQMYKAGSEIARACIAAVESN